MSDKIINEAYRCQACNGTGYIETHEVDVCIFDSNVGEGSRAGKAVSNSIVVNVERCTNCCEFWSDRAARIWYRKNIGDFGDGAPQTT